MLSEILIGDAAVPYRNENTQKPPRSTRIVQQASAQDVIAAARQNTATVWRGDFQQAKQILSAVKKRTRIIPKPATDAAEAFHKYRLAQSQNSRMANMLLVPIGADLRCPLPRAPDVRAALADVYGDAPVQPFVLSLNLLLGLIGAHEWHKKGVDVPQLGGKIHVPFGVFSPVRGEYLRLLADAPLPENVQTAFDVGTGSGVIAALLAKRGVPRVLATDNNPRAVSCARENVQRLGLAAQVDVQLRDMLPEGGADLIVCNPPWLPAKPTSAVETAVYDPEHAMLRGVLRQSAAHLRDGGEFWIVLSDLAVHLGLRTADALPNWFDEFGWQLAGSLKTQPVHPKSQNADDVLAFARRQECTMLYRLVKKE